MDYKTKGRLIQKKVYKRWRTIGSAKNKPMAKKLVTLLRSIQRIKK